MESPFDDFTVENDTIIQMPDADTYLWRVGQLDNNIDAITDSAKVQIDRIKLWEECRISSIEQQKSYLLQILHNYLLSTGEKSQKLVNGTLSIRKQQDEIIIDDNDAIIKDGRFIREKVTVSVDKAKLKEHLLETGEIIEGITVNSREPKFSYKLNP